MRYGELLKKAGSSSKKKIVWGDELELERKCEEKSEIGRPQKV